MRNYKCVSVSRERKKHTHYIIYKLYMTDGCKLFKMQIFAQPPVELGLEF